MEAEGVGSTSYTFHLLVICFWDQPALEETLKNVNTNTES